jgi:hypothetical protein
VQCYRCCSVTGAVSSRGAFEYDCSLSFCRPKVEASKGGHASILQMLLTAGAEPNTQSREVAKQSRLHHGKGTSCAESAASMCC